MEAITPEVSSAMSGDGIQSASPRTNSPKDLAAKVFTDVFASQSFGFSAQLRWTIVSMPLLFLFSATRQFPVKLHEMPPVGQIVLSCLVLAILASFVLLIRAVFRPAVILNATGITHGFIPLAHFRRSIRWEQVTGLTVEIVKQFASQPDERLKIVYQAEGGDPGEILISSKLYAQGDQLVALLKQLIPPLQSSPSSRDLFHLHDLPTEPIKYRDYLVSPQGIELSGTGHIVPWDAITAIRTDPMVIAGYGATTIEYVRNGTGNITKIPATTSEAYRECVNCLIKSAPNATLDPALAKITNYPVSEAKADSSAVILLIFGIILAIAGLVILAFYPPTVVSTWLYPLLLLPFGLLPFVMTLKLLAGRFTGDGSKAEMKVRSAMFFNGGIVISVAILFISSPASFIWLLADACAISGNLTAAEAYYKRCEPQLAGNEDFIFTLGQFYFKKHDWESASKYYIQSYQKDPTNWLPVPLSRIPEALSLAGRHDDALAWCEAILKRYSDRKDVVRIIRQQKDRVIERFGAAPSKK